MKITGAIFDMDGTLLDSMDYWAIVAGEYLKSKGVTPFDDDNRYFLEDGLTAWYKRAVQAHGINASIEEVTAEVVMPVDDVEKLTHCDGLRLFFRAEKRVANVDVHAAVTGAGTGYVKSFKVDIEHCLEGRILVSYSFLCKNLRNDLGASVAAKGTVVLKLEHIVHELLKHDFLKDFCIYGVVLNAVAFSFDFKAVALQRETVRTIVVVVKLDRTIGSKVQLLIKSGVCVVFVACPVVGVVGLDGRDGDVDFLLARLLHLMHFLSFKPFGSVLSVFFRTVRFFAWLYNTKPTGSCQHFFSLFFKKFFASYLITRTGA